MVSNYKMSEENCENRARCLENELTNINRTLEDLKNTFHWKQQHQSDYQQKIENVLPEQELFKLQSELEPLTKERQEKETRLTELQKDHSETLALLQNDVQKLTEILKSKIEEEHEEVDLDNTSLGQEEILNEELTSKEAIRDDLYHLVNRLNSSITVKIQDLEELRADVQGANSERIEMIDMLNNALDKMAIAESVQPKGTCDSNSLFNEVNDKRVSMKKSLADLKTKCMDMTKLIDSAEKERMVLWQMRGELRDVLDNHPKQALCEYNALIEKYRATRTSLEEANLEYQKLLCEKEKLSISTNYPDDIFSFHDEFIKRKEETRERLKHLFRTEVYANDAISRQKTESKREHYKYNCEDTRILKNIAEISLLIKEIELHARENKKNDPPCETAKKENDPVAPVEKKVSFEETVVSPPRRPRGRVIQSKPIHIPSDLLQKKKE